MSKRRTTRRSSTNVPTGCSPRVTNLDAPDPWFVFWPAPKPLDDLDRGTFILERRPIAWLCPPSPDADQIARGWNYRLLPQDPALAGNPTAATYPYASVVAVPAEWPALEGAGATRRTWIGSACTVTSPIDTDMGADVSERCGPAPYRRASASKEPA